MLQKLLHSSGTDKNTNIRTAVLEFTFFAPFCVVMSCTSSCNQISGRYLDLDNTFEAALLISGFQDVQATRLQQNRLINVVRL